jgi:hypothetical protein
MFMDLTNKVFRLFLDKFVVVFMNYILIYSSSHEKYEVYISRVLQVLMGNQLYAKIDKCEFWLK